MFLGIVILHSAFVNKVPSSASFTSPANHEHILTGLKGIESQLVQHHGASSSFQAAPHHSINKFERILAKIEGLGTQLTQQQEKLAEIRSFIIECMQDR